MLKSIASQTKSGIDAVLISILMLLDLWSFTAQPPHMVSCCLVRLSLRALWHGGGRAGEVPYYRTPPQLHKTKSQKSVCQTERKKPGPTEVNWEYTMGPGLSPGKPCG